jgi:NAD(P)-dependent dehydrogenase (short-subunit alcohol dehydrogenase family)
VGRRDPRTPSRPLRADPSGLRHWKATGTPGHIVCTASTSGLLGNFGQANYGAAKAGIAAFSTIVAQEMSRYAVTCNAIAPAARTRMTEGAYGDIPVSSGGFDFWHPDNIAPMAVFLCSSASDHISGKVFGVQGDTVEIYRPWTSAAVIENGGKRWQLDASPARWRTCSLTPACTTEPRT